MHTFYGSQLYFLIPDDKWLNLVPAFISKEAFPDQSIGWFDNITGLWVRPTWEQAAEAGVVGPVRILVDTTNADKLWYVTKFLRGHHPPMLRYPDESQGILEVVTNEVNKAPYTATPTTALDLVPAPFMWLTLQEVYQVLGLTRINAGGVGG